MSRGEKRSLNPLSIYLSIYLSINLISLIFIRSIHQKSKPLHGFIIDDAGLFNRSVFTEKIRRIG